MRLRATLSLDLDDAWTYVRASGRDGWESSPTVIPVVCERLVEFMASVRQRFSLFVVARDLLDPANAAAIRSVAAAGHEIGCHSFDHRPEFATLDEARLRYEVLHAVEVIEETLGRRPIGFRAPGYARHPKLPEVLEEAGFRYDGSSLPTFLGPLCRAYYFRHTGMSREQRRQRAAMYGGIRDALAPNRAHLRDPGGSLLTVPVTTFPVLRAPIHMSYVIWLARRSRRLALAYLRAALLACRVLRLEPSYLLHSLDFVGSDERPDLAFFPGMDTSWATKRDLIVAVVGRLQAAFDLQAMDDFALAKLGDAVGTAVDSGD